MGFRFRYPHLSGYQIISLLLLALIGLFLGVVSFASFGVLNITREPIGLLYDAIDILEEVQRHQDENDAKNEMWRNLMINDHLFLSGMTALKKQELDLIANELGVNITALDIINGTNWIMGQNMSIPIPPSAIAEFKRGDKPTNNITPSPFLNPGIFD